MSTVLSRRDSVKPSWGPATTDSFTGSAMPRLTNPFMSAISAPDMVSTISAASPLNTRESTVDSWNVGETEARGSTVLTKKSPSASSSGTG